MITIIADFDVKCGKEKDFIGFARECVTNTKKEAGCLSYRVYVSENDGTKFTFIEEWANETAVEKHNSSRHFKMFIDSVTTVLNHAPSIKRINSVIGIR